MKIGVIHPSFTVFGGAENTTMCILDKLKRTEHITTLYTVDPPPIEKTENFKIHKIERHNFPSFWRYQRMKEIQQIFRASNSEDILVISSGGLTLEETNVKKVLLYCHSTFESDFEFCQKKFSGIKAIYHKMIQANVKKSFETLQNVKVNLISNSNYTRKIIKDLIHKDSTVIYPPVDITKFSKWFEHPKEKKILTLSRFSPEKNLKFAIDVIRSGNYNYELIGNAKFGSQANLYNELKNSTNSSDIRILHNLSSDEIQRSLSSSKVYFHPSKETFGISVVEAISAGCIPIVPDDFAFIETVPFDSLRFKDKEDAVNKLKDALDGKYDHLRGKLRQHIEKFSIERFQNELLKIIESVN